MIRKHEMYILITFALFIAITASSTKDPIPPIIEMFVGQTNIPVIFSDLPTSSSFLYLKLDPLIFEKDEWNAFTLKFDIPLAMPDDIKIYAKSQTILKEDFSENILYNLRPIEQDVIDVALMKNNQHFDIYFKKQFDHEETKDEYVLIYISSTEDLRDKQAVIIPPNEIASFVLNPDQTLALMQVSISPLQHRFIKIVRNEKDLLFYSNDLPYKIIRKDADPKDFPLEKHFEIIPAETTANVIYYEFESVNMKESLDYSIKLEKIPEEGTIESLMKNRGENKEIIVDCKENKNHFYYDESIDVSSNLWIVMEENSLSQSYYLKGSFDSDSPSFPNEDSDLIIYSNTIPIKSTHYLLRIKCLHEDKVTIRFTEPNPEKTVTSFGKTYFIIDQSSAFKLTVNIPYFKSAILVIRPTSMLADQTITIDGKDHLISIDPLKPQVEHFIGENQSIEIKSNQNLCLGFSLTTDNTFYEIQGNIEVNTVNVYYKFFKDINEVYEFTFIKEGITDPQQLKYIIGKGTKGGNFTPIPNVDITSNTIISIKNPYFIGDPIKDDEFHYLALTVPKDLVPYKFNVFRPSKNPIIEEKKKRTVLLDSLLSLDLQYASKENVDTILIFERTFFERFTMKIYNEEHSDSEIWSSDGQIGNRFIIEKQPEGKTQLYIKMTWVLPGVDVGNLLIFQMIKAEDYKELTNNEMTTVNRLDETKTAIFFLEKKVKKHSQFYVEVSGVTIDIKVNCIGEKEMVYHHITKGIGIHLCSDDFNETQDCYIDTIATNIPLPEAFSIGIVSHLYDIPLHKINEEDFMIQFNDQSENALYMTLDNVKYPYDQWNAISIHFDSPIPSLNELILYLKQESIGKDVIDEYEIYKLIPKEADVDKINFYIILNDKHVDIYFKPKKPGDADLSKEALLMIYMKLPPNLKDITAKVISPVNVVSLSFTDEQTTFIKQEVTIKPKGHTFIKLNTELKQQLILHTVQLDYDIHSKEIEANKGVKGKEIHVIDKTSAIEEIILDFNGLSIDSLVTFTITIDKMPIDTTLSSLKEKREEESSYLVICSKDNIKYLYDEFDTPPKDLWLVITEKEHHYYHKSKIIPGESVLPIDSDEIKNNIFPTSQESKYLFFKIKCTSTNRPQLEYETDIPQRTINQYQFLDMIYIGQKDYIFDLSPKIRNINIIFKKESLYFETIGIIINGENHLVSSIDDKTHSIAVRDVTQIKMKVDKDMNVFVRIELNEDKDYFYPIKGNKDVVNYAYAYYRFSNKLDKEFEFSLINEGVFKVDYNIGFLSKDHIKVDGFYTSMTDSTLTIPNPYLNKELPPEGDSHVLILQTAFDYIGYTITVKSTPNHDPMPQNSIMTIKEQQKTFFLGYNEDSTSTKKLIIYSLACTAELPSIKILYNMINAPVTITNYNQIYSFSTETASYYLEYKQKGTEESKPSYLSFTYMSITDSEKLEAFANKKTNSYTIDPSDGKMVWDKSIDGITTEYRVYISKKADKKDFASACSLLNEINYEKTTTGSSYTIPNDKTYPDGEYTINILAVNKYNNPGSNSNEEGIEFYTVYTQQDVRLKRSSMLWLWIILGVLLLIIIILIILLLKKYCCSSQPLPPMTDTLESMMDNDKVKTQLSEV